MDWDMITYPHGLANSCGFSELGAALFRSVPETRIVLSRTIAEFGRCLSKGHRPFSRHDTAACHRIAETCGTSPRRVLRLAVLGWSESDHLSHLPNERQNDWPLGLTAVPPLTVKATIHSGPEANGFPFLSHFRSDNSLMKRPGICSIFTLGGLSLFSALSLPFAFSSHSL
jgi:hypothetical protein